MSPSAPAETKEAPNPKQPDKAAEKPKEEKKVDAMKQDTHDKAVAAATPATNEQHPDLSLDNPKYTDVLPYSPLPEMPTKSEVATTFATGASIALPVHVGLPVVGALAAAAAWKRIKHLPILSTIDRSARFLGNGAKNTVGKMWKTATYLPKTAATIGLNAAKFVPNAIGRTWQFGVNRFHDVWHHTPGESKSVMERLTDTVTGIPGKMVDVGASAIDMCAHAAKYAFHHPVRALVGTSLAVGIVASNGGPILFSKNLAQAMLQIFQGIAAKVGGAAATL